MNFNTLKAIALIGDLKKPFVFEWEGKEGEWTLEILIMALKKKVDGFQAVSMVDEPESEGKEGIILQLDEVKLDDKRLILQFISLAKLSPCLLVEDGEQDLVWTQPIDDFPLEFSEHNEQTFLHFFALENETFHFLRQKIDKPLYLRWALKFADMYSSKPKKGISKEKMYDICQKFWRQTLTLTLQETMELLNELNRRCLEEYPMNNRCYFGILSGETEKDTFIFAKCSTIHYLSFSIICLLLADLDKEKLELFCQVAEQNHYQPDCLEIFKEIQSSTQSLTLH